MSGFPRVLVVTAVEGEADAVLGGAGAASSPLEIPGRVLRRRGAFDVLAAGVGPAAAAAGTAAALAAGALRSQPYGLVVSAGIGGGFAGTAPLGSVVVADTIVAADLGAETPEGFLPVTALGFGTDTHRPPAGLSRALAEAAGAVYAPVLTVSTVTGSAARAALLADRHPGAGAEAMEGFGVAEAAAAHGLPVLEIRAVSNPVGPRDRAAWRIPEALDALAGAAGTLTEVWRTRAGGAPHTAADGPHAPTTPAGPVLRGADAVPAAEPSPDAAPQAPPRSGTAPARRAADTPHARRTP